MKCAYTPRRGTKERKKSFTKKGFLRNHTEVLIYHCQRAFIDKCENGFKVDM